MCTVADIRVLNLTITSLQWCALQADYTGLGVVLLDALTQREWILEETLAEELQVWSSTFAC